MYFSSGPKIKALASEIKKKWNLYTSIKQIIKKHAVYMSEKFETNGIKELNHQVFLKKYLGTLMPNHCTACTKGQFLLWQDK